MDFLAYQNALRERVGRLPLPFDPAEYRRRQDAVRAGMRFAGLDALLVTHPGEINYLCGYETFEVSVHTALLVTPESLVLQVPSIETGPAVTGTLADEVLGYRWEGIQGVVGQLAERIDRERRAGHPVLGVDLWGGGLRAGVLRGLEERLPGWSTADAAGIVGRVRRVKSRAELAILERSARLTELGLDAAVARVSPGTTDSEIAAAGAEAMLRGGSEFMSMQPIVAVGRRGSVIHTNHRRTRVEPDDPVFLEFGSAWCRYTAPAMRTVVAGRPSGAMRDVCAVVEDLFGVLCERMRPGRSFDQAAEAAEQALRPVADRVFFSGVYGYTVGAAFPPSWVEGSGFVARGEADVFEVGMVFHLPLCLRVPGEWGIGFSETVRVTEAGARPVTANRWGLLQVP